MFYGRRAHVIMHAFERIQGYTRAEPQTQKNRKVGMKMAENYLHLRELSTLS